MAFAKLYGGSTAYQGIGSYLANDGELEIEEVTILESLHDETKMEQLEQLAKEAKIMLCQESVMFTVNNEAYFI